jgi:mono/diheme cytochrome c family protein
MTLRFRLHDQVLASPRMRTFFVRALFSLGCAASAVAADPATPRIDKLTYHSDAQRSGWNADEPQLTPKTVSSPAFGQQWQSPQFDSVDGQAPRLFATPLYVDKVAISAGPHQGRTFSVVYAVSHLGFVYAVNAAAVGDTPPGTILWQRRLSAVRPGSDLISTPTIDATRHRLYVVCAEGAQPYRVHALDLRSGEEQPGWPAVIDPDAVNAAGVNRNGTTQFSASLLTQRGALNLSPDRSRLYVSFAQGATCGWIIALDTDAATVATAFSATPRTEEVQGGMWGSGGPSIDADGYVHIATGSSVWVYLKKLGVAGIFPNSEHNWGQSLLRLRDTKAHGFELAGTYTPFNYVEAQVMDIDLGSSGTTVIDLDPATTSTPQLLVVGGKQGNVYLLDRAHLPGSLVKRPPGSDDSSSDGSLLAPDPQPQFGKRGPLNVFGPYANENAMNDQARSRTTPAFFRSASGKNYVFLSGSAKTGRGLDTSTPPGLVRLEIVTSPGRPAYLKIDQLEGTQTFQNPGSPVVTSQGGQDAIVWVLDTNVPRTAPLYGPDASRPILYAFDALTLQLLWKNEPGELAPTGKYNEPTVVNGLAIVGTDRVQAFGLRTASAVPTPGFPLVFDTSVVPAKPPLDPEIAQLGKALFDQRCAACHTSGLPGIPPRDTVSKLEPARIFDVVRNGVMKPQGTGLSDGEVRAVAAYLSSLAPTAKKRDAVATPTVNVTGRALYVRHCILCHMPDGSGVPALQPALRDNPLVRGEAAALVRTILSGPAASAAGGRAAVTPAAHAYGPRLSDEEAASLVTYVRQAFGAVSPAATTSQEIAAQRQP